jgi:sigma-B regulation protein RsbU (phosphoserine phosphatase)
MDPSLIGLGDLLTGTLIAAAGLLALAISLFRRQGIDPLLASFGAFALLFGVRQFFHSEMTSTLGVSVRTAGWITSLITYVILMPAWYFFWKLLGDGWHSLILWWLRIVTVFAVVGIASDVIQGEPGTLTRHPNNLIVLGGLVVAITSLLQYRGRMTTDLKILAGGLLVFGLFSINDNLVSMELLPWDWREESIGFLVFLGCLFLIAVRHFFSTERELAAVEGELEAARRIQTSILPDGPPRTEGLSIAVRFRPSSTVAGDFYDFLDRGLSQIGLVVADVSGHGVPAALIASMVKIAVASRVDSFDHPARLLSEVNRTLIGNFQHGFVTAAYAFLDTEKSEVVIASAGHPHPFLLSTETANMREVGGSGTVLGRFADAVFHEERYPFNPGDRLVLYTDGIVEAQDAAAEMFGEDRLGTLIGASASLSAEELADRILGEVRSWSQNQPQDLRDDDLTLVIVDRVPAD